MIVLENGELIVSINEKGAELTSVKANNLQYIWEGDPKFWGKHSPVLFPIVGGLKNNQYTFEGNTYQLGRHGFARDHVFTVLQQTSKSVLLGISDSEDTFKVYPFHFQFLIRYTIRENKLLIEYTIKNTSAQIMYYSVGAHPAFSVPLEKNLAYEDYYLSFDQNETSGIYPLDDHGQILTESVPFLEDTNKLALQKSLFYKDALVFKDLKSTMITIRSDKGTHGLTVDCPGFPYMGIWSAKDADFVCIEPWHGIADNVATTGDLTKKEGILTLEPAQLANYEWAVTFF